MTDRELLEAAARAAGVEWAYEECGELYLLNPLRTWNPLADDGDALRLACKLKINIEHMMTLTGKEFGVNCWPYGRGDCGISEDGDFSDYAAATRRAITRAAAAIGTHKEQA
jgi:hypothetical protein